MKLWLDKYLNCWRLQKPYRQLRFIFVFIRPTTVTQLMCYKLMPLYLLKLVWYIAALCCNIAARCCHVATHEPVNTANAVEELQRLHDSLYILRRQNAKISLTTIGIDWWNGVCISLSLNNIWKELHGLNSTGSIRLVEVLHRSENEMCVIGCEAIPCSFVWTVWHPLRRSVECVCRLKSSMSGDLFIH